jgi:hypothetical protein
MTIGVYKLILLITTNYILINVVIKYMDTNKLFTELSFFEKNIYISCLLVFCEVAICLGWSVIYDHYKKDKND